MLIPALKHGQQPKTLCTRSTHMPLAGGKPTKNSTRVKIGPLVLESGREKLLLHIDYSRLKRTRRWQASNTEKLLLNRQITKVHLGPPSSEAGQIYNHSGKGVQVHCAQDKEQKVPTRISALTGFPSADHLQPRALTSNLFLTG